MKIFEYRNVREGEILPNAIIAFGRHKSAVFYLSVYLPIPINQTWLDCRRGKHISGKRSLRFVFLFKEMPARQ